MRVSLNLARELVRQPWQATCLIALILSCWRAWVELRVFFTGQPYEWSTAAEPALRAFCFVMLPARIYLGNIGVFRTVRHTFKRRVDAFWLIAHGLLLSFAAIVAGDPLVYFVVAGAVMLSNTVWLELRRSSLIASIRSASSAKEDNWKAYDILTIWFRNNLVHLAVGLLAYFQFHDQADLSLWLTVVLSSNSLIDIATTAPAYVKAMDVGIK